MGKESNLLSLILLDNNILNLMETTRQQKIARLLQKDLGDIFLRYAHKFKGVLISVSEVRVSSDLSIAHIYLSIFPSQQQTEVIEQIEADKRQIRGEMGNLERHQLRIIPELSFHIDQTLDKMSHIDELLKQ